MVIGVPIVPAQLSAKLRRVGETIQARCGTQTLCEAMDKFWNSGD